MTDDADSGRGRGYTTDGPRTPTRGSRGYPDRTKFRNPSTWVRWGEQEHPAPPPASRVPRPERLYNGIRGGRCPLPRPRGPCGDGVVVGFDPFAKACQQSLPVSVPARPSTPGHLLGSQRHPRPSPRPTPLNDSVAGRLGARRAPFRDGRGSALVGVEPILQPGRHRLVRPPHGPLGVAPGNLPDALPRQSHNGSDSPQAVARTKEVGQGALPRRELVVGLGEKMSDRSGPRHGTRPRGIGLAGGVEQGEPCAAPTAQHDVEAHGTGRPRVPVPLRGRTAQRVGQCDDRGDRVDGGRRLTRSQPGRFQCGRPRPQVLRDGAERGSASLRLPSAIPSTGGRAAQGLGRLSHGGDEVLLRIPGQRSVSPPGGRGIARERPRLRPTATPAVHAGDTGLPLSGGPLLYRPPRPPLRASHA